MRWTFYLYPLLKYVLACLYKMGAKNHWDRRCWNGNSLGWEESQQGVKDTFRMSWNRNLTGLWKTARIPTSGNDVIKSWLEPIEGKIYIKRHQIPDRKVKFEKFSKTASEEDEERNKMRGHVKYRKDRQKRKYSKDKWKRIKYKIWVTWISTF